MSDFKVRDTFIPYNQPDISDAEINDVVDTLKSGWIGKGPAQLNLKKNSHSMSVQSMRWHSTPAQQHCMFLC